jgi:hypothetical protein
MPAKSDATVVQEWLNVLKIATDADSPFAGMVDLRSIFGLPLAQQQQIFDGLTPAERDRLKALYGPKKGGER